MVNARALQNAPPQTYHYAGPSHGNRLREEDRKHTRNRTPISGMSDKRRGSLLNDSWAETACAAAEEAGLEEWGPVEESSCSSQESLRLGQQLPAFSFKGKDGLVNFFRFNRL